MALFSVIIVWVVFAAIFLFVLYHVILVAINESNLAKDVRKIKELLAARRAESAEASATPPMDPALAEVCPGCGKRVHPEATVCPDCGLRLA